MRFIRPAVRFARSGADGRTTVCIADIVAVMSITVTDNSGAAHDSDFFLLQHYMPAVMGEAPNVLCPPEHSGLGDLEPLPHPLVPGCAYVILSNEFTLARPSSILGRAILVPNVAYPGIRSPPLQQDVFTGQYHNRLFANKRAPFFALQPAL